jgi:hypothetical protein
MAKATAQDAAGEEAIAGALNSAMSAATAREEPTATTTGITIQIDDPDKGSLSRPQGAALARARALLAPAFTVSVSFSAEEAGEAAEETDESGAQAAA